MELPMRGARLAVVGNLSWIVRASPAFSVDAVGVQVTAPEHGRLEHWKTRNCLSASIEVAMDAEIQPGEVQGGC